MKRGRHYLAMALAPLVLTATAFIALAAPASQVEPPEWADPCDTGAEKWADPAALGLGGEATITMVMTGTCAAYDLPKDIVFVVDRSNSMRRGVDGPPDGGIIGTPGPGTGTPPDSGIPFPTQEKPEPTDDPVPPKPTGLNRSASIQTIDGRTVRGLAQGPIVTPPSGDDPPPTTGPDGTSTPPDGDVPPGIGDPTRDLIRRDREEPPGTEELLPEVRDAITSFLDHFEDELSAGRMRVALVSFNNRARVEYDLNASNNGASQVRSRLFRLRAEGNTRIDLGLSAAQRVLYGVRLRGRSDLDHSKTVILFSDGRADPRTTARLRLRDDITYISVAVGREADMRVMANMASEREFALTIRDRQELAERVAALEHNERDITLNQLTIVENLTDNVELVPNSAVPPVNRVGTDGSLEWDILPPLLPVTITYNVRPLTTGQLPVAEVSEGRFQDSLERDGVQAFPPVELDVSSAPTPVPSDTPEPTPSDVTPTPSVDEPTKTPGPIMPLYLPITVNDFAHCVPQLQTVDIALAVDTSQSMSEPTQAGGTPKIEAAIAAGQRLVDLMKAGDQAAVIGFNQEPTVLAGLTGDRSALRTALRDLITVQQQGTQIDAGLQAAADELTGPDRRVGNNPVIILVTDGRQHGAERPEVVDVANAAKAHGITLWTVAIGGDADVDLLREIASRRDTFVHAPNADDLAGLYEDIARQIPCP